jgi:hypothetical protein
MRNTFNFDGQLDRDIEYDPNGVDGKRAFQLFDAQGKLVPTKHPNILRMVLKVKGSTNLHIKMFATNLHIKMFAEDRAKGVLPGILFKEICIEYDVPLWFKEAVEHQKGKYY